MPVRSVRLLLFMALILPACATIRAPRDWLETAAVEAQQPFGGWTAIWLIQTTGPPELEGELLAIAADTAWVLTLGGEMLYLAANDVLKAQLETFDPGLGMIRLGVAIGSLSTLSHGFFSIFSLPVWLLGALLTDRAVGRSAVIDMQKAPWETLRVHARYPQGLPPGVDTDTIDPKRL